MVAPVLDSVDTTMRRVAVTRILNEAMGSSLGPFDWDDWPAEMVDTIIESRIDDDGE